MKIKYLFIPALTAVIAFQANAATILIDGTSPGYVNDGSFENQTDWLGTGSNLATYLGIADPIPYRNTNGTSIADGVQYIAIGSGTSTDFGAYLDTGYDLVLSDTFDLSFSYGEHSFSSGNTSTDMDWQLFTTSTNDDTGTVEDILASGTVTTTATRQDEILTSIGSVTVASAGERLFIAFTPGVSGDSNYTALDEVNLTVVPEPSAALLIGFGSLLLLIRRRREG